MKKAVPRVRSAKRKIIIIAGPNGAGKSTFAREYLPNEAACPVFVNADLIAAGLAPFAPATVSIQAGRLMLEEIRRHAVRVVQGGHDIPEPVIRRRFTQGWRNFSDVYCPLVDSWQLYDNSGEHLELIEWS